MQEYGRDLSTEGVRVRVITLALEGAATWMVTLHNTDVPELQNFNHFMKALRSRFKDCRANQKARDCIKIIKQGH